MEIIFQSAGTPEYIQNAASWLQLKSDHILGQVSDPVLTASRSAVDIQGLVPNQEMLRMMNCCGWLRLNLRES